MPRACQICNHPERLSIDREIVSGKSKTLIAREFGVSTDSVANHQENHVSRQMAQAWSRKSGLEATSLLADIKDLVGKARLILDRNLEKNSTAGDLTALNAIREQRGVFELLVKIAAYLHEARLLELQNSQEHLEAEQAAQRQEGMSRLSFDELEVMLYLTAKMNGDMEGVEVPAVFRTPAPIPRQPLPRPKIPCATEPEPVYAIEAPDPGLTPGLEPEPEIEPEPPHGLPPLPVKEIPGGGRGLKLRRHLLGRKIYNGLPER